VQHIQRGWAFFNEEMNEFVDLLPAQQRVHGENWYRGTADAVTQNLDIIRRYDAEYVVILAGDHIYKQDYSRMLLDHVEKGRAVPWPACRSRLKRQALWRHGRG
jgi:glucose-1-phosphate adenylyltransferase